MANEHEANRPPELPEDKVAPSADNTTRATSAPTESFATTLGSEATSPHTGTSPLSPGRILGDRYRILKQLGRGGMGEVWLAFDLKLKKEVALKSLRADRFAGTAALELLRSEVRAAHEVLSPNVCRIYDLVVDGGHELVSMEYVDGRTLTALLKARGPLDVTEAQPIASQFLAGIEAIHTAQLLHRDIKPDNVMITRTNRVVIMDFGIAKGVSEDHTETVTGTPAYMAPEQMFGDPLDERTDLFAAGMTLAEMVAPSGIADYEARQAIWRDAREDPPRIAPGPWQHVLERAVASEPDQRFASAGKLARALEEVTLRHDDGDDKRPYPGLASFTTANAQYFFGRESEVEQIWRKLESAHLVALIGASGAGKSSFVQAGVIPAAPEGWRHVICHPGSSPIRELVRALQPELAEGETASRQLMAFDDPDVVETAVQRWRRSNKQVLIVVDQFEELFTLNTPDVQRRFTELIGRLILDADAHVLLSMRDDFFLRCHEHPALEAIFSEPMPLGPPTGAALRRALVQPALACGYRFEDEALVEEMLRQLGDERGSLPLLAFAVASLWEKRDRDRGLLTRAAYERIGGVGGALAQHAESTLERIGAARRPLVREIFRNLVTAQGTRAVLDLEDLISVFDEPSPARAVVEELVDSRLLTCFDVPARQGGGSHERRVEIIHETLLESWPRLVRWRTQDADSALLRDQLRQTAQLWAERGRSDDLLWTGAAFQEFQLWHSRYPGGLTSVEDDFARAMVDHAQRQARRRRRLIAGAFVALIAVLAVVGVFWRKSAQDARRAEASNFFALGQLRLEQNRTLAVAYAIASLERADDPAVRRFVLEALWRGPTAFVLRGGPRHSKTADFSPDGDKLLLSSWSASIALWSADGSPPQRVWRDPNVEECHPCGFGYPQFLPDSQTFTGHHWSTDEQLRLWSIDAGEPLKRVDIPGSSVHARLSASRRHLITQSRVNGRNDGGLLQVWAIHPDSTRLVAQRFVEGFPDPSTTSYMSTQAGLNPAGEWLAYAKERHVEVVRVADMTDGAARAIGEHDAEIVEVAFHPDGERIVVADRLGAISIWSRSQPPGQPVRTMKVPEGYVYGAVGFDREGRRLATPTGDNASLIWDLVGPPDQQPLKLDWPGTKLCTVFHPNDKWLAVATGQAMGTSLWPLGRDYPRIIKNTSLVNDVVVGPDGSWLLAASEDGSVRLWSLESDASENSRVFRQWRDAQWSVAVDPAGSFFVSASHGGHLRVVDLRSGSERELPTPPFPAVPTRIDIDASGRYVASGFQWGEDDRHLPIRVYDLTSGTFRSLDAGDGKTVGAVEYLRDGRLLAKGGGTLRLWDVENGTSEVLLDDVGGFVLSEDERFLVNVRGGRAFHVDLQSKDSRELTSHGAGVRRAALDPTGTIVVTAGRDRIIRVGPVTGEEPHLLVGHKGAIQDLEVSPDGRWIISASDESDGALRLWPIPEGTPFHTLPHREFLERLRSLTNVRIVGDAKSASGHRLDFDTFPGWEAVPTW